MTPKMLSPTIGLAVLSWRAPETLIRTLESYERAGLSALVARKLLYFSDQVPADAEIATRFGYELAGGPNAGITGGMVAMAEILRAQGCEQLLLMQNDLPAMTSPQQTGPQQTGPEQTGPEQTARELATVSGLIAEGRAQLGNLRHRWLPGQGFGRVEKYLGYWPERDRAPEFQPREHPKYIGLAKGDVIAKKIRRVIRPGKARQVAGGAYYLSTAPEACHPDLIEAVEGGYLIDSSAQTYSDQSLLVSTEFYFETLIPFVRANSSARTIQGFPDAEPIINHRPWWGQQHFTIAHGKSGIFSHDRKDGFQ